MRITGVQFAPGLSRYIKYLRCHGSNLKGHSLEFIHPLTIEFFLSNGFVDVDAEREALPDLVC